MRKFVTVAGVLATLAFVGASIAAYFACGSGDAAGGFFVAAAIMAILTGVFHENAKE